MTIQSTYYVAAVVKLCVKYPSHDGLCTHRAGSDLGMILLKSLGEQWDLKGQCHENFVLTETVGI